MKKILLVLALISFSCSVDHTKERQDVCNHSEGLSSDQCNAGDDFSPDTCLSAMTQFEAWWRDDAQTTVNNCITSSACYVAVEAPGPSITVPLQLCLATELLSLQTTDAQTAAVSQYCVKASSCKLLDTYTIADCEQILLSPYDDGQLFLMMNDDTAKKIGACDTVECAGFSSCVTDVLHQVGVFNSVKDASIKMPALMQ